MMIVVSNDAGRLAQNARTKPAIHPFAEQLQFLSIVTVGGLLLNSIVPAEAVFLSCPK